MKLWVDDIRLPPDDGNSWLWAKTSYAAITWMEIEKREGRTVDLMSLDHDLGGDDTTRAVVLWCCTRDYWPTEIRVHTANPVGREWLEGMIGRYKR